MGFCAACRSVSAALLTVEKAASNYLWDDTTKHAISAVSKRPRLACRRCSRAMSSGNLRLGQ